MTYAEFKDLKPSAFKRFCGVKPQRFARTVQALEQREQQKKKKGRDPGLALAGQLLLTLQYWRDFKLFKRSRVRFAETTECPRDRGYQGLQKRHARSQTPHKKPPRRALSQDARRANRALAKRRIVIKHVIGKLKVFRLLLESYRNRRKRFGLRTNFIAVIYNLELKHRF